MGRPPTEPAYDPKKRYPAKEAGTLDDLLPYLARFSDSAAQALSNARNDPDSTTGSEGEKERTSELLSAIGALREDLEIVTRLIVEFSLRDRQFTLRQVADLLNSRITERGRPVSYATPAQWRLDPVSMPETNENDR